MTNTAFIFDKYRFDAATGILHLHYAYEGGAAFEERITFPAPIPVLPPDRQAALDAAFRLIFLMAGVSYYKAYVPRELKCTAFPVSRTVAAFIEKIYRNGLSEFAFQNKIDLSDKVHFVTDEVTETAAPSVTLPHRLLVPVGGGKDSIVSIETLKKSGVPITLYAQGKAANDIAGPIEACIAASGLPALRIGRALSRNLFDLNKAGALNGHVPITAILSSITVACAILYGFDTIILSNEHSASAPNLKIGDIEVNHQYSKSLDFENDFAAFVRRTVAPELSYFSLLRPLTEAAITRRFAALDKYHALFRSCNTAFRQEASQRGTHWCCDCPKCRFVFLALAPFMEKEKLVRIFGKDMLNDATQKTGFAELCGLTSYKPFECVGEIEESALLMEKLYRSEAWKNDAVVQDLGGTLAKQSKNFDVSYDDLFTLRPDHNVPAVYLRLLNESL